jgi:hypothetical protein
MTSKWRLVLAPWTEGGRLYTYFLPPLDYEVDVGDVVLVEGPKGQPKFLVIAEIKDLEPLPFPAKSIANAWQLHTYNTAKEEGETLSMHPDYPKWQVLAGRLNNGEDLDPEPADLGEDRIGGACTPAKYSAAWVKYEVESRKAYQLDHHNCSFCGSMVKYVFINGQVEFDSNCDCSRHRTRRAAASYQEIADWLAVQESDEIRDNIWKGLRVVPAEALPGEDPLNEKLDKDW